MHRLSYGPDPNHFGHLRIPAGLGRHPLVVVIHGGFWRDRYDLSHMEPLCEALLTEGLASWSLEYRRIGQPGGGWPGTADDVFAGVQHRHTLSRAYAVDPDRSIVLGYSAGGHLALCAASIDSTLKGVVSLAGVADLQRAWDLRLSDGVVMDFLGKPPSDVPLASPAHLPITIPQRLIHGDLDESVPISMVQRYARVKREAGESVELLELTGVKHGDLVDPQSAAWPVVRQAVTRLL